MNHCVPDFKPNDERRPSRSSWPEDEFVELLWQNGQVVLQSQNQRSLKKSLPQKPPDESTVRISQPTSTVATEEAPPYQVFMQEDEMSSWLHYPLDEDFCPDLLYPVPSGNYSNCSNSQIPGMSVAAAAAISPRRPPIPRPSALQRVERLDDAQPPAHSNKFHNFMYFSRSKLKPTVKSQPSAVTETTMVGSSDTPAVRRNCKAPVSLSGDGGGDEHDRELMTCDLTVTSSSGGSGASGEPVATASLTDDRKRKASKIGDHDFHNDELSGYSGLRDEVMYPPLKPLYKCLTCQGSSPKEAKKSPSQEEKKEKNGS